MKEIQKLLMSANIDDIKIGIELMINKTYEDVQQFEELVKVDTYDKRPGFKILTTNRERVQRVYYQTNTDLFIHISNDSINFRQKDTLFSEFTIIKL